MKGINLATYFENSALAHPTKTALIFEEQGQWTMNYPAASHGVSKARQQHENHLEASFGVWTRGAIKHKGYRVSSSEIEVALQDHPAVFAACAVGVPDEKTGERIKAFVVLKQDVKGVTGYDLIRWCRDHLASYKIPHYIEFRDMLPKSKVGKLLRRELMQEERKRFEEYE